MNCCRAVGCLRGVADSATSLPCGSRWYLYELLPCGCNSEIRGTLCVCNPFDWFGQGVRRGCYQWDSRWSRGQRTMFSCRLRHTR